MLHLNDDDQGTGWQGPDLLTPPFAVSISGNPLPDYGANPAGDPALESHPGNRLFAGKARSHGDRRYGNCSGL